MLLDADYKTDLIKSQIDIEQSLRAKIRQLIVTNQQSGRLMLDRTMWPIVYRKPEEVPPARIISDVRAEIVASLGKPIGAFFAGFSREFPRTVAAMTTHWAAPILALREYRTRWFASLVLEGDASNLFFDLADVGDPMTGPFFESEYSMLPTAWKELYRGFWSFTISSESIPDRYWKNTPVRFPGRIRLADYQQHFKGARAAAMAFARRLNSQQLTCWLVTDAGESLWLDEKHRDGRVYHVRQSAFEDAAELSEPGATLDRFLAHIMSGGAAGAFEFRN